MPKAFIAHTGIITSIGANTAENLDALIHSRDGISQPEILKTVHHFPVGEIKGNNEDLTEHIRKAIRAGSFIFTERSCTSQLQRMLPRTALLSILAAQEAWRPFAHQINGLRIGLISANTVGGMDLTENFYQSYKSNNAGHDIEKVRYHENGAITILTSEALGLDCWSTTISTACSSSANSIMMGAKLIEQNRFDVVLAGGADALSRFTLNGFNSLMILDKEPSRPFDQNRKGLNLGEGAAYLVLANEKALDQWKKEAIGCISGYANANDAHHQTASSPEGKGNQLAMLHALKQAKLDPEHIDYINLHGTGTENNDASEGRAIEEVFQAGVPFASSTKAFTGHTLGAAGAVEAVFSVLCLQEQTIWPNLRLNTPMKSLNWQPETNIQNAKIKHILSNSFGFGGNCSTLIISRV